MKKGYSDLLSIISDGKDHSGEDLAIELGVSRAAIWKSIKSLQALGLTIEATHGKGYRLLKPVELLSEKKIKSLLSLAAKKHCKRIEVLFNTESTNSYLLNCLEFDPVKGDVVLAEYQSAGKGRRGNQWVSPLAGGIYLSVGWRFEKSPVAPGLLSLYTGVAIVRALKETGMDNITLKWPNDILIDDNKLGGVLLELRGETCGAIDVIIGVGINYELPEQVIKNIDQEVTDICRHTKQRLPRNKIVALLISHIFEVFDSVQEETNIELLNEWREYDCYKDQLARLILPDREIHGLLKGVDEQGSLLMSVDGNIQRYTSGEISLRKH